ncbi:uncharacterized protein LOC143521427 isoform X1 [Brachyhypopomus gauderio]|uniref:uncharacterized protein LOC143521427 isoform X1 n=1 Tax=Brachyhypopomus gauderio TaxID=698409 RepID=UPI00404335A1
MGVTHGKKTDHSHQQLQSGCAQPLIGPDSLSDVGSVVGCDQRWDREEDLDQRQLLRSSGGGGVETTEHSRPEKQNWSPEKHAGDRGGGEESQVFSGAGTAVETTVTRDAGETSVQGQRKAEGSG